MTWVDAAAVSGSVLDNRCSEICFQPAGTAAEEGTVVCVTVGFVNLSFSNNFLLSATIFGSQPVLTSRLDDGINGVS